MKFIFTLYFMLVVMCCSGFGISDSQAICSNESFNPIEYCDAHYMIIRSIPGSYTVFYHSYDGIYLNSNRFIPVYISDGDTLIIGNSVYVYRMNIVKNSTCISGWFDSCGNYTNVQIPKNKSFYLFSKTGCKIAINNSKYC